MCIGIPMQVIAADATAARAQARGRDGARAVGTRLVGPCAPGDWLLVFLDDARERLSAQRAAEIDAVLDLLGAALAGQQAAPQCDPGFALPSAQPLHALRAFAGEPRTPAQASAIAVQETATP